MNEQAEDLYLFVGLERLQNVSLKTEDPGGREGNQLQFYSFTKALGTITKRSASPGE